MPTSELEVQRGLGAWEARAQRAFIQGRPVSLPAERQDVHTFLLENLTNGGLLELMMRYLKAMGHKFLLRWPPGLAEVVLSIYHSWRRHSTSLPNPLLRDCSNKHIKVGAGPLRAGA